MSSDTPRTDDGLDEFLRVARTFSDEHYQNSLVAELRRAYRELAACREELKQAEARGRNAAVEECSDICNMTHADILLRCGEMSKETLRTIKAVIDSRYTAIRAKVRT